MLPDRTYVVSEEAARALTQGGVTFTLGGEYVPPPLRVVASGRPIYGEDSDGQ